MYEAYDGDKAFLQVQHGVTFPEYDVRVTDEFVGSATGKVIMIGHGISGGKYYGLDQPYPYYHEHQTRFLTYVITSGTKMVSLVAKQSGVSERQVLPLGLPRTDAYIGKAKGDGGTILSDKRAYLYVPTYRTKEETPLPDIDWRYIDGLLSDDEMLVVKAHPMTEYILREPYRHIFEAPASEPSTPYLIDSDVVITDYSSILFDAHVLGKPVVLFEKQKGYEQTRGMYLEYPQGYASRYATNETELVETIRNAWAPGPEDKQCLRHTADMCDGHATERLCDLIRRTANENSDSYSHI